MSDSKARKAFKDWFDAAAVRALAEQVSSADPGFDKQRFSKIAKRGLTQLEFGDRVRQLSSALRETLPEAVPDALGILSASLPAPLPNCDSVTDGWLQWPLGQFIADYGLEHFEPSMDAMVELTMRFSSEFAVRPFVERRPDETFARLQTLTEHQSPHVRRWCSEGTRPRLPWGKKLNGLIADPGPIWPILEALKDDSESYVTRSVANNLNDIAKDHPKKVVALCNRWSKKRSPERAKLVRHALRTLIKAGDRGALKVVGIGAAKGVNGRLTVKPKTVRIGGEVELSATLTNTTKHDMEVLIDYVVHYVRKRGETSPKVFKWTRQTLAVGRPLVVRKRQKMRATSTRQLWPGSHKVELQVNGAVLAETSFRLFDVP